MAVPSRPYPPPPSGFMAEQKKCLNGKPFTPPPLYGTTKKRFFFIFAASLFHEMRLIAANIIFH